MDSQAYNKLDFICFCEQILKSAQEKSVTYYAVGSFLEMLKSSDYLVVTEDVVGHWVGYLLMKGMKFSSVKRYFGRMHSLYNEWREGNGEDVFENVLPILDEKYQISAEESKQNLSFVNRLLSRNETSGQWTITKIFLFLLYNVELTFADVVNLTFDSYKNTNPQSDDIVDTQEKSFGRKYVFDLRQGKSSESRIVKNLTADISTLLCGAGMKFSAGFSRSSITSMWISAAMAAGVDLRDIKAILTFIPADYYALNLIPKRNLGEKAKNGIICRVANYINDNTSRWFVMKIRSGVSVDDVKKRIDEELPGKLKSMILYYPTRTSVKKEGKKTIKEEIPYIPNLLFFKTQRNKIRSLFAKIGDLAWCFRVSAGADNEYAVISNNEMTNFQRSIGQFTPDIKMELVEMDRSLTKGRRVRIVGGMMAGYEGEIIDVDNEPEMKMFFLSITNSTMASWKVKIEDVFIEPLD